MYSAGNASYLAVQDNRGRLILPCPTCRHDTPIPATGTGVADLQSAFHINYLLEIQDLNTGSNGEVVNMKTRIVKQMNKLTSTFQPDILKLNTEADITFSVSPDVTAACQNYGEVFAARDPDPSRCHATGKGLEEAVVGKKSIFHFNAVNFKDNHAMNH